jgi:hypothetical protein
VAISGRFYALPEDGIGWQGLSLTFPGGDEAIFLVVQNEMAISVTVGLDEVRRATTVPVPGVPVVLGTKGRWEGADTFVVDLLQVMPMQRVAMTFRLTFQGDGVDMVLSVEGEQVAVHGQAQQ